MRSGHVDCCAVHADAGLARFTFLSKRVCGRCREARERGTSCDNERGRTTPTLVLHVFPFVRSAQHDGIARVAMSCRHCDASSVSRHLRSGTVVQLCTDIWTLTLQHYSKLQEVISACYARETYSGSGRIKAAICAHCRDRSGCMSRCLSREATDHNRTDCRASRSWPLRCDRKRSLRCGLRELVSQLCVLPRTLRRRAGSMVPRDFGANLRRLSRTESCEYQYDDRSPISPYRHS